MGLFAYLVSHLTTSNLFQLYTLIKKIRTNKRDSYDHSAVKLLKAIVA